jgi:hypothetical protein
MTINGESRRIKNEMLQYTGLVIILKYDSALSFCDGQVVVDFKPLASHHCGFESRQGLWIPSCEEAIQLAYGTSVVLLRCLFVPEIMHGRAPEVFLQQ